MAILKRLLSKIDQKILTIYFDKQQNLPKGLKQIGFEKKEW